MKCVSRSICITHTCIIKNNNNNKVEGPKKKKRSFSIRFSRKKHIFPKRVKKIKKKGLSLQKGKLRGNNVISIFTSNPFLILIMKNFFFCKMIHHQQLTKKVV